MFGFVQLYKIFLNVLEFSISTSAKQLLHSLDFETLHLLAKYFFLKIVEQFYNAVCGIIWVFVTSYCRPHWTEVCFFE